MKLPTPSGRMTVTYGMEQRVKVPVWDEEGLKQAVAAERQRCAQIAREFDTTHPSTNFGGCIARLIEEQP